VLECDKACFPLFLLCLFALTLYQLGITGFSFFKNCGTAVGNGRVF
jgi:hypothetical protein